MNEDFQAQSNIQAQIKENTRDSAYSVGPIPAHMHTGTDSPKVSLFDIAGTLQMVTTLPTIAPNGFGTSLAVNTNKKSIEFYDLTNKVWSDPKTKRVVSQTTAASYTINTDITDLFKLTALGGAITISSSGTPSDGDALIIRIKDNGSSQTLNWDATKFVSYGSTLPAATTAGKTHTIGFLYDSVAAKWGCVASQIEP